MNGLQKCMVAVGALAVVAGAARIKSDKIETRILELPKISLEAVNYSGLSVEYALGKVTLDEPKLMTKDLVCKQGNTNKLVSVKGEYYKIDYNTPPVFIVVKDNTGAVVYAEKVTPPMKESTMYGFNECRFWVPGAIAKEYQKDKPKFMEELLEKEMKKAKSSVKEIIHQTIFARYAEESFKLSYVDDKNGEYNDLTEAYKLASAVYKNYDRQGYLPDVVAPLKKAIEIWNKALTESNLSDKKARINYKITLGIHENIAIAYMFLNDYQSSLTHFNKIQGLQKTITTSSASHHFSQVRNRAMSRLSGISLNRDLLSSPDKIKAAVADAERYGSQIKITDMQSNYSAIKQQCAEFKLSDMAATSQFAAESQQNAAAAGTENPYENKVIYSVMQGYAFMKTPLMALGEKFTEVPVELCDIERLNELIITKNTVARIPPEIGKLKNLKLLNLKDNQIAEVPDEICQLINVETIDLSGNKIKKMPAGIGQLKNLKTLKLKDNPLPADEIARIKKALPDCKVKN